MKIIFKIIIFSIFLLVETLSASGQEYVLPLENNPVLLNQASVQNKKGVGEVLLELPIVDDFSANSPFPSSKIWADSYAYINNGYAVEPPSVGVATMDALDENGSVYSFATISPETFNADLLSSYPINLNYPASDSIYLSFYYQPQGTGLEPRPYDSLCLDFYIPDSGHWYNVWRVPGDSLHAFKRVMIPITDPSYLKEGFRFGFRNKASLPQNSDYKDKRGNVDHWNIDYVQLDRSRNINDTIIRDVAFSKPTPSMLKKYQSIPWDHFRVAFSTIYLPYISLTYFNNDTATRNVTRTLQIYDEVWNELYAPGNSSTQDILPGTSNTYNINNIYPFKFTRGDTASFMIKTWLRTDDFDNKANDTIYRRQVFRDYFAYDDGSAERAYGLRGQGTSNGLIAVRYDSYIADELGGVDVYFTQLKDSLNLGYYFKFMVWNDIDGLPGNLIYEGGTDFTAAYSDYLNKYVRFEFDQSVSINGIFYVGVLQYNQFLLNIGLDINTPASGNLLYSLGSEWLRSAAPGSLMLRPFVKRTYSSDEIKLSELNSIKIFPNPANEFLSFQLPEGIPGSDISISIYDISGKLVHYTEHFEHEINIGALDEGVYLISFNSSMYKLKTEKLLISR